MAIRLSPKTLEWTLEHFARHNDTDIFGRPFEFQAVYHCKDEFIQQFSHQDISEWKTRLWRRCLVPKQRYGFRLATQLDPLDMIVYFGLFLEAGEAIERARIRADQCVSFSSRFAPDNTDYWAFDRNIGFEEFLKHCRHLAKQHSFVAVTDIADFYPRIYLHPLENALTKALPTLPNHAKAFIKLLKGWYQNVSYGIPIGNTPSRLLAEIAIDDIDKFLLAEGIVFTRYVDDYRIFCESKQEAYKCLIKLANTLYDSHGLTLQAQKTKILTSEEFVDTVLDTPALKEFRSMWNGFDEILQSLGVDNSYDSIDYFDLSPDARHKIDGLNLEKLLHDQLAKAEFDVPMTKWLINRLGQLRRAEPIDELLNCIDNLHPVLSEIIRYLSEIGERLTPNRRQEIGALLLSKLGDSVLGRLEFNRMQIMSLFVGTNQWGNAEKLPRFYGFAEDAFFNRKVLLALGRSGQDFWLRAKKQSFDQMPPWDKRAFLYAASCLPKDERDHWYRAVRNTRDELERYVIPWALENPIA